MFVYYFLLAKIEHLYYTLKHSEGGCQVKETKNSMKLTAEEKKILAALRDPIKGKSLREIKVKRGGYNAR